MLKTSLKVLKKLESAGFESYIIGGFVRDNIIGIDSVDVDIATAATPREIKKIFHDVVLPKEDYGAVTLIIKNIHLEITTFRKELSYSDNRKPKQIEYIDDLYTDLKRRDFRMNTVCMNSKGEFIDHLEGIPDIKAKVINSVGDPSQKFEEDPLRILRAIRFATTLNFSLSKEISQAIKQTKESLSRLSYQRKREELDKIFSHVNAKVGISLIKDLDLDKELEIYNINDIKTDCDLIGIWASLELSPKYPFTKNERNLIKNIKEAINEDNLDTFILYKYGLYVNIVAASIKGNNKKKIAAKYQRLPIKSVSEIKISSREIIKIAGENAKVGDIFRDVETSILNKTLNNSPKALAKYVREKYGDRK